MSPYPLAAVMISAAYAIYLVSQTHGIIYSRQQQRNQIVDMGCGTAGRMHPPKSSILRRAQRSSPFRLRLIDSWTSLSTLCTPTRCAAAAFMAFTHFSHKAPIPIWQAQNSVTKH